IMHLPDDCLSFIFQRLDCRSDRESFGLTCHRWLNIQNISRRSLEFNCSFTQLDISLLSHTRLASRLKFLNLRMCRTVDDESIAAIAKECPLLKEWNLALCHEVRISGWMSIGLNCHKLKKLHVNRCRNLCDRGLQALRDGCKQLSVL
ncbi:hypothetical protein CFOL_v3_11903, partial [Cephalotus follicularis]